MIVAGKARGRFLCALLKVEIYDRSRPPAGAARRCNGLGGASKRANRHSVFSDRSRATKPLQILWRIRTMSIYLRRAVAAVPRLELDSSRIVGAGFCKQCPEPMGMFVQVRAAERAPNDEATGENSHAGANTVYCGCRPKAPLNPDPMKGRSMFISNKRHRHRRGTAALAEVRNSSGGERATDQGGDFAAPFLPVRRTRPSACSGWILLTYY